ncbi:hypothetical protein [Halobaculum gomorrense]|uniref:hypothetical protein n=1 Tax=Halobaculum gomorrense TaxID=43928 RepID=UPI0011611FB3|nr:hypothetical protein [Halobaculum gomorrense]
MSTLKDFNRAVLGDFRNFWYNEFASAASEFLNITDLAANAQGSSVASIVSKHYLTAKKSRKHFLQHSGERFGRAFNGDLAVTSAGAEENETDAGNGDTQYSLVRGQQSALDEYINGLLPGVAVTVMASLLVYGRACREQAALEYDSRTEQLTPRKTVLMMGLMSFAGLGFGLVLAMRGINLNPLAGPVDAPPPFISLGVLLGALRALYEFRDLEEPSAEPVSRGQA